MNQETIDYINEIHKHKISPYYRGGYYTRIDDTDITGVKHTKIIVAESLNALYEKLIDHYPTQNLDNITVNELFSYWMKYREEIGTAPNTLKRDEQRYKKYCSSSPYGNQVLRRLKRTEWKQFCSQIILGKTRTDYDPSKESLYRMTAKEWASTKSILNGMMSLAVDEEIIPINIMRDMKFEKSLFKQTTHKTKSTEVFNTVEELRLVKWCNKKFLDTLDPSFLFPPLNLMLGLRVGECVALTWSSWIRTPDGDFLNISRSEYINKYTNVRTVEPHTKTFHERIIPISSQASDILKKIKLLDLDDTWIFVRNGERMTTRQANYILELFAKENGLKVKSSHKLRKTCGSNLYKAGASIQQCSDYLGNTIEVFQRNYCFDTDTDDIMRGIINSNSLKMSKIS